MAKGVADDLNELGFRAYCPMGRKVLFRARVRGSEKRQRKIHSWAVFGRYIFVGEIDEPLQVDIHGGIVEVIGDSRGAWALNPKLIRAINEAHIAGQWDTVRAWDCVFKKGDRVKFTGGHPLEGFLAIVDSVGRSGVRVNVPNLFSRPTMATVHAAKLEMA
jgi:transcription antitermination factor NusG